MAARVLPAWMVPSEPSLPMPIDCSSCITSPPRTSPTITRSGDIRRAALQRSYIEISPMPSVLDVRVSSASVRSWSPEDRRCSSRVSSMVTTSSDWGTSDSNARSRVVLPAPVPPTTSMLAGLGGRTAARSTAVISGVTVPYFSSDSSEDCSIRWRRITTEVRSATAVTANSRCPEASRRSRIGAAVSKRRDVWPAVAARWRIIITSSSSLAARGGAVMRFPSAKDRTTLSWPRMWMFSTSSRSSSGTRAPPPIMPRTWARNSRSSSSESLGFPIMRAEVLKSRTMTPAVSTSCLSMTSVGSFWRSNSRNC